MKKKIELEYSVPSSPKVLFKRLSTDDGLAEWFADSVNAKDGKYTFSWEGEEQIAELISMGNNEHVRFRWEEDVDEDYYFEFKMEKDPLTGEVALIITDFVDEDDEDDAIELWDKQIEELNSTLGV